MKFSQKFGKPYREVINKYRLNFNNNRLIPGEMILKTYGLRDCSPIEVLD